jgi:uncharacterized protein
VKKTLLLGATTNPGRYAYLAAHRLQHYGHPLVLLGIKPGMVGELPIQQGKPDLKDIDTITLYLNATRQEEWQDYILSLRPKRIIFNPGAENPVLAASAAAQGIEVVEGCTLVMLSIGNY